MAAALDEPAFWAVVEHHRLWWAADGPYRRKVEQEGKLSDDVAGVIARNYGVARTIGGLQGADGERIRGLPDLVASINGIPKWPDDLPGRAAECLLLANAHAARREGKIPISAVTKLMWFLRPASWTMFDNYARLGLIGHSGDATAFYAALKIADFEGGSRKLKTLCDAHGFRELWGERIIDKFLMLHGASQDRGGADGSFYARARWMNEGYLALLPVDMRNRLTALARAVRDQLVGQGAFPVWSKRMREPRNRAEGAHL